MRVISPDALKTPRIPRMRCPDAHYGMVTRMAVCPLRGRTGDTDRCRSVVHPARHSRYTYGEAKAGEFRDLAGKDGDDQVGRP
jgi:hypothetical protein